MAPSIESKLHGGYTWTDFIHEYRLNIKIAYIIEAPSNKRLYIIHVGSFEKAGSPFTIWDQVQASMKFKYHTLRDHQKEFIAQVGKNLPVLFSTPINVQIKKNNTTESVQRSVDEELQDSDSSYSINLKNIIHVHFVEKILKQWVDVDRIWSFIDEKKLVSGINELIKAVKKFLAFYATVLGKPNMSPCWCTWCMFSKAQWSAEGHCTGPEWALEKIFEFSTML